MTEYPWEPPLAGTEVEQLTGALDRLRTTFRWKADDLTVTGLQARFGASSLTLGGLLKHLAMVEGAGARALPHVPHRVYPADGGDATCVRHLRLDGHFELQPGHGADRG